MTNRQHDIERYLRGEMTRAEMHALERKALDDVFLSDALQGASSLDSDDFASDIQQLQRRMQSTAEKKKIISMWTWPLRIAAGLLVIALAIFTIVLLLPDKPIDKIALNKTVPEEAPAEKPPATTVEPGKTIVPLPPIEEKSSSAPPKITRQSPVLADQTQAEEEEEENQLATNDTLTSPIEDRKEMPSAPYESEESYAKNKASSPAAAPMAAKKQDSRDDNAIAQSGGGEAKGALNRSAITDRIVKGQVTASEDGAGLPGVNVIIKGTNIGTVTDSNGDYQVTTSANQRDLVFSFIGLESKEVTIDAERVDVQMDQDVSQLSEVVVVGYSEEGAAKDEESPQIEMAAPAGGRGAFKRYLEKSLQYPQLALENNVEGKVTVQFTVERSGRLSDFTILKGIGYGCDQEVVRLIRNGPRWSATKRNGEVTTDKVKVRLRFRLPRKK